MMALIANCHNGKGRALTANDFNPTLTKEERLHDAILITDENVELMRDEFKRVLSDKINLTSIIEREEQDGRTIGN